VLTRAIGWLAGRRRPSRDDGLLALALVLATVAAVAFHPDWIGFPAGHHGFISSESLAMITRAGLDNGFVGYVLDIRRDGEPDGVLRYSFDRNPPVLFATMHAVIAPWSSDPLAQVRVARAFMLGIFLLTVLVCQRIAALVLQDPVQAMAAALLTTSGYYFMRYKDMIDFAQPGVLAMLVLVLAIGRRIRDGRGDVQVFAAAILAATVGVGLPSVLVAVTWFACEALALGARRLGGELTTSELARRLVASTAWRVAAVGGLVATAWLAYSIGVEMVLRDVSVERTSIFLSVMKRAGFDPAFLAKYGHQLGWANFHRIQAQRFDTALVPHWLVPGGAFIQSNSARVLLYGALAALVWHLWSRRPDPGRLVIPVCALFGPVWIYAMRYTTHFHDYFSITYGGTILMAWAAALALLPRQVAPVALAIALAVFGASARSAAERPPAIAVPADALSEDLARIRNALPAGAEVHVEGGYDALAPGAPYVLGFWLNGAIIHPLPGAPYVLTRDAQRAVRSLTPRNSRVFLVRRRPPPRYTPRQAGPGGASLVGDGPGLFTQ
jgi:hypothetical protein